MTQSGQGEQPSARPAREGIVLPSDGGEPLLPGMTGDQAVPAGGRSWDRPWGPDPATAPAPQPGEGWGPQANGTQAWGEPGAHQPAEPGPDWGAHDVSQGSAGWSAGSDQAPDARWGASGRQDAQQAPQQAPGAGPLPAEGAQPQPYGGQQSPSYGGHGTSSYDNGSYENGSYGNGQAQAYGAQGGRPHDGYAGAGPAPLPHAVGPGALPPAADEGATQYIPPVPAADEGATQFLPPIGPGALPPEVSGGGGQFPGHAPQGMPGAGSPPPAANPDAEATQYMAPVPADPAGTSYGIRPGGPEDRQPPAEFDNLFRTEPGAPEGPASTQQLPRFEAQAPHTPQTPYAAQDPYGAQTPHTPYATQAPGAPGGPGGRAATRRGAAPEGGGGRGGSRLPLIAAVGIGIVVLGVGAGALLSGGGSGDSADGGSKNVSATAAATEGSASAGADPAKAQAVALDKLLADSNNSRDSVVKAVENVKACNNLGQAAGDLRDAAKQRAGLVTRLSALSVDKLPNHAALTNALNNAWKASASADNHYAAWADQVGGKRGCKGGHARATGQTQAANAASGTASAQKSKAAGLWNAIASKYGLTQRTPIQL
ncbi:hypothetical protein [Streptomyces sp. NBC_01176]|uniref:hypothetical protein n=1 Tax=Streptomyces sp. NBC_01176 TaxID=2903760 RepID=UPI00386F2274|nr:hypothetical protein OG199_23755 [Streptomyces sp. NBC_01176]